MTYLPGGGGESGKMNRQFIKEAKEEERDLIMTFLEEKLNQKRRKCRTMVDIQDISEWFQTVRDHKERM